MIDKNAKIYVAGHKGLVGSAILKNLQQKGYSNFVVRAHRELDLTSQTDVSEFFDREKPEYVILAAAKVGGIMANNLYRADFIYQNLMIQNNVIHQAYLHKVKKLIFLGSTCVYPKNAQQPISENQLLTSELEYTNEPYAIAKIAGLKMCESYNLQYGTNFVAVMPTNLYGPNDNFDLETSHVLPALVRKVHLAKCIQEENWNLLREDLNKRPIKGITHESPVEDIIRALDKFGVVLDNRKNISVKIWGTGKPRREFLWSEDMADATTYILEHINFLDIESVIEGTEVKNTHINIGTGIDITIEELIVLIVRVLDYKGKIEFDSSKPDGTLLKLSNVDRIQKLGWKHSVEIKDGIKKIYDWYLKN